MSVQYYKPSSIDFAKWIRESVWINGNTKASRFEQIQLVTEDLAEWIQHYGYVMNNEFTAKAVAHWLYAVAVVGKASGYLNHQRVRYPEPEHRDWQEDYDYFLYTVTQSELDKFLVKWRFAEGFEPDTRMGQRLALELSDLLYTYLDLERSPSGKKIAEFVDSTSSDSDHEPVKRNSKTKDRDVYLQEMNEGGHGGGVWSKV